MISSVTIITNPISGNGQGGSAAETLESVLTQQGVKCDLFRTSARGEAEKAARETTADCVVSVGGDGTNSEVANGVAGTGKPMAILPMGTANVLARELGFPQNPEEAAKIITRNRTRNIDCGLRDGRRFIMGAGAGLDAKVVEAINGDRSDTMGHAGWIGPTLNGLLQYEFPNLRVSVDGESVCDDAHCVLVRNCGSLAGIFPVMPETCCDDGVFDILIIRALTIGKLPELAAQSFTQNFHERDDLIYKKGRIVELDTPDGVEVPVQCDGDPAGVLPARFEIEPKALTLLNP